MAITAPPRSRTMRAPSACQASHHSRICPHVCGDLPAYVPPLPPGYSQSRPPKRISRRNHRPWARRRPTDSACTLRRGRLSGHVPAPMIPARGTSDQKNIQENTPHSPRFSFGTRQARCSYPDHILGQRSRAPFPLEKANLVETRASSHPSSSGATSTVKRNGGSGGSSARQAQTSPPRVPASTPPESGGSGCWLPSWAGQPAGASHECPPSAKATAPSAPRSSRPDMPIASPSATRVHAPQASTDLELSVRRDRPP